MARFWAAMLDGEIAVETADFCAVKVGAIYLGAARELLSSTGYADMRVKHENPIAQTFETRIVCRDRAVSRT